MSASCGLCGAPCTLKCARCHIVHYCNRACQVAAWGEHKAACNATKSSTAATILAVLASEADVVGKAAMESMRRAVNPSGGSRRRPPSAKRAETPLHRACMNGDARTARSLISRGAALDARMDDGDTPLHQCGTGRFPHGIDLPGQVECVRELVRAGCDVDAVDDSGITALACAAFEGAEKVAAAMLAGGADASIADKRGRRPFEKARDQGHARLAATLFEAMRA